MKRYLALLLLSWNAFTQVPVAPVTVPHVTFVNASGGPCAGCTMSTFVAGTTTPLATYVDSGGVSQNTNPIVLDAAGGANIWLSNASYKLVLKTSLGATIWTVDNVKGGGGLGGVCGPSGSIQIANSAATGLTCDSSITINTTNHTLNVGTLTANHVTIGALSTPTSWTFDTTTPATALASLGGGTVNPGTLGQLAFYATGGSSISGTSAIPSAITATTQSPGDNSGKVASTAYVALPGAINPTSVKLSTGVAMTANQGNGTSVQHSTGATTTNGRVRFDANGNTIDAGPATQSTTTGHVLGGTYQNTTGGSIIVMVAGVVSGIGCTLNPFSDASITPTTALPTASATPGGGSATISVTFMVINNNYYKVTTDNCTTSGWAEWANF